MGLGSFLTRTSIWISRVTSLSPVSEMPAVQAIEGFQVHRRCPIQLTQTDPPSHPAHQHLTTTKGE